MYSIIYLQKHNNDLNNKNKIIVSNDLKKNFKPK